MVVSLQSYGNLTCGPRPGPADESTKGVAGGVVPVWREGVPTGRGWATYSCYPGRYRPSRNVAVSTRLDVTVWHRTGWDGTLGQFEMGCDGTV